jgi:hypothetical protein
VSEGGVAEVDAIPPGTTGAAGSGAACVVAAGVADGGRGVAGRGTGRGAAGQVVAGVADGGRGVGGSMATGRGADGQVVAGVAVCSRGCWT